MNVIGCLTFGFVMGVIAGLAAPAIVELVQSLLDR